MSDAKCVIYVKKDKNAIFDTHDIRHILYLVMAIWVSKHALGPQEYRPITLDKF